MVLHCSWWSLGKTLEAQDEAWGAWVKEIWSLRWSLVFLGKQFQHNNQPLCGAVLKLCRNLHWGCQTKALVILFFSVLYPTILYSSHVGLVLPNLWQTLSQVSPFFCISHLSYCRCNWRRFLSTKKSIVIFIEDNWGPYRVALYVNTAFWAAFLGREAVWSNL